MVATVVSIMLTASL